MSWQAEQGDNSVPGFEEFTRLIQASPNDAVKDLRQALSDRSHALKTRFEQGDTVTDLLRARAATVDGVIVAAWSHFLGQPSNCALIAVGGYGRGELHPYSDIDLMILAPDGGVDPEAEPIGRFLTFLWDIGLEVGHSVRNLADCDKESRENVQTLTTLLESRLLDGPPVLYEQLKAVLASDHLWPPADFFRAKVREQNERHHRYHDTAYNLEPNVKGSPGGLRDIQMISWLGLRQLGSGHLDDLLRAGFLTDGQLRLIKSGREFLWRVRFALHMITGRREDRLLFDHQTKLAKLLGYEDASYTLAVEQLMQRYYRTVMEVSRLNEMLIQLFEEDILLDKEAPALPLSPRFQARNGYLEAVSPDVFQKDPSALLEIFLLLEQNLDLRGVNAKTISLIKQHLYLIDEEFRQNPRNHRLFLEILHAPQGVTRTLKRMNLYGVLGLYIPAFGRIVGRMQYDLFHAYTVDAHTLFVVENLRRFSLPRFDHEFPECSRIMQSLDKPEIAYLAGLFHDIAKGRGGDHSELGAVDAESFCLEHGMSRYDARLVAWLVAHHLLLSLTAQKRDINDPDVVSEFARTVGDRRHLDYLYVLTVADVRGTNPTLWNSWKDSLFRDLYRSTRRALRRGLENPIDKDELIADAQTQAAQVMGRRNMETERWQALWARLTDEYFIRYRPEEIAWHAEVLTGDDLTEEPVVHIGHEVAGAGTTILIFAPYALRSFARLTGTFDELGLNVVDARIVPTADGHSIDTYSVLESDGSPISDPRRRSEIERAALQSLTADSPNAKVTRRAPRQVRMFSTPVHVSFSNDDANGRTVMELTAGDRPGLLSRIARVLRRLEIDVENAKITTVGERAEDVFFISKDEACLDDEICNAAKGQLETEIADLSAS